MMDIQKILDLMRLHADITIYVQKNGQGLHIQIGTAKNGFSMHSGEEAMSIQVYGCSSIRESIELANKNFRCDAIRVVNTHVFSMSAINQKEEIVTKEEYDQRISEALRGDILLEALHKMGYLIEVETKNLGWYITVRSSEDIDPGEWKITPGFRVDYATGRCRTFLEACERVWGRFIIPAEGIILGPAGNSGK